MHVQQKYLSDSLTQQSCSCCFFVRRYDAAKQWIASNGVEDGPVLHALSSAVAGLVAATVGTPADVIKTRCAIVVTLPSIASSFLGQSSLTFRSSLIFGLRFGVSMLWR